MTMLREGLPPLPARFKKLPVDHRGYPIPWFVADVDGKRDFRMADGAKRVRAVTQHLCWLCGEKLGRHLAFVIGPMCVVNRNTSEPPSHRECAEFALQACPFLTLPQAQYRGANLPEGLERPPMAIDGNPGVSALWICDRFQPYRVEQSWLIRLGDPTEVTWWTEGRAATRAEVLESMEERLPALAKIAQEEGEEATIALGLMVAESLQLLPKEIA